jgi:hypothetical protein
MSERVTKWQPVSDINSPFGSISYSFHDDVAEVHMVAARTLVLRFSGVVALRFEQECPSFDFPAVQLPMLRPSQTFPLLLVSGSKLLEQFSPIYGELSHFGMVSSDHLLQILAKPTVEAHWKTSTETSNQAMEPTANRPCA